MRRHAAIWTEQQLRLLCDGSRNTLAAHLLIEFKYSESFGAAALLQALSYDFFYRRAQKLTESEVQTFVMVARTPRAAVLQHFGYVVTELPGVYRSNLPLLERVQVIVLNQLRPETHNVFVQYFASQRKIRNAAFARLSDAEQSELNNAVWDLMFGLRNQFEWMGDEMSRVKRQEEGITPESLEKLRREIRQMLIASLKPEERLAGLTPEERKKMFAEVPPRGAAGRFGARGEKGIVHCFISRRAIRTFRGDWRLLATTKRIAQLRHTALRRKLGAGDVVRCEHQASRHSLRALARCASRSVG